MKKKIKIEYYETPYDKEPVDRNKKRWEPLPKASEALKRKQDGTVLEHQED